MGRAFEFRKELKCMGWGNMGRVFTRIVNDFKIGA